LEYIVYNTQLRIYSIRKISARRSCSRNLNSVFPFLVAKIGQDTPFKNTPAVLITFRVSRRRREMYSGHARLSVCLCVCPCVRGRMPMHYCTDPDVTWGMVGVPPSCALLGGFAIGARVTLIAVAVFSVMIRTTDLSVRYIGLVQHILYSS